MADQDVLVAQFIEDPNCVPTYDRFGEAQSDGMEFLSDAFGLKKMATAMCLRPDRTASLYVSAYRGGANPRSWTAEDCEFLQCAVDNISAATRVAALQELSAAQDHVTSMLISRHGATIVGLDKMRARFGHLWSRRDGDQVPRP